MDFYKRFRFVKELTIKEGTFPVGGEITVLNDKIYYNGGMVTPLYYSILHDLLEYEFNEGFKYLKEVPIPYNKV